MGTPPEPIAGLVATIRASVRLRDGYYLSEELVDLYLVGVLRGVAVGLLDADGPHYRDQKARTARLDELARFSADLLEHLHRLRPPPATISPTTAQADPAQADPAQVGPASVGPAPADPASTERGAAPRQRNPPPIEGNTAPRHAKTTWASAV